MGQKWRTLWQLEKTLRRNYPVHLTTSHYNCPGFDCPDFIQTPLITVLLYPSEDAANYRLSLKTNPARSGKTQPGFLKILQLTHVNLTNYFFRTDSIVLISVTFSLLRFHFMPEIRETSDVRNFPWQMFDSKFHGHQPIKLQLSYKIMFDYIRNCK